MAIGVLGLPITATESDRLEARLALSLLAYKLGYFMVDTIELPARSAARKHGWVEALARRVGADAVVVGGSVDRSWLAALAERRGLVVVTNMSPSS
jgi:predicted nucleic acid-binding protein